jgi:hypothetical protein
MVSEVTANNTPTPPAAPAGGATSNPSLRRRFPLYPAQFLAALPVVSIGPSPHPMLSDLGVPGGLVSAALFVGNASAIVTLNTVLARFRGETFFATISYAISNASNYRQGRRDLGEPVPNPSVDDAKLRVQPIWATLVTRLPVVLVIFGVIALVIWAIYR